MFFRSWVQGSAIATLVGLNSLVTLTPALAQTSPNPAPRNTYPDEVIAKFTESCMQTGLEAGTPAGVDPEIFPVLMQGMCSCMIWQFQDRYTIQQMSELVAGAGRNEPWADNAMNEVVGACIPQ